MSWLSKEPPSRVGAPQNHVGGEGGNGANAAGVDPPPPLYDRIRHTQPGMVSRSAAFWQLLLPDPDKPLNAPDARYSVVYQTPEGQVDGAPHYPPSLAWGTGLPHHTPIVPQPPPPPPE